MEELDVRSIACFKSVVSVIGEIDAIEQLTNVYTSRTYTGLKSFKSGLLVEAFTWSDTPQGGDYWARVYNLSNGGWGF